MGLVQKGMRQADALLEQGEQAVTACACQMKGTLAAGALGGVAGTLVARKLGKGKREDAAASGFPLAQSMMLVVTDRRLLVLNGKKLLGALGVSDLSGAEVVKRNALSPWTIRIGLANGEGVTLEANRYTKPGELVDAVERLAKSR